MKNILCLQKPLGQTPLECIEQFRTENPAYTDLKMCYAGRLDPMAEGLLLVLKGDECQKRNKYERLPKTYEFDVLFGVETDTYDSLGIVTKSADSQCSCAYLCSENSLEEPQNMFSGERVPQQTNRYNHTEFIQQLQTIIPTFIGTHTQPYPPYSSARVDGKPLFWWAREGRLNEIEVPSKQIEIYDLQITYDKRCKDKWPLIRSLDEIQKEAIHRTTMVKGQFRQKEIAKSWRNLLAPVRDEQCSSPPKYPLISFHISCSSGTYVRSIAHEMGKRMRTGAIAWRITRTHVGQFTLP